MKAKTAGKMKTMSDVTTESTETDKPEVMGKKLKAAARMAETQQKVRRERQVKGSHLLSTLQEKATQAGLTFTDKNAFIQISGPVKGRRIYLSKKGGRVDLSGFTVEAPAIKQITEVEAREKHLGKVRAQLDFTQPDSDVLAAYDAAIAVVAEPAPAPESK